MPLRILDAQRIKLFSRILLKNYCLQLTIFAATVKILSLTRLTLGRKYSDEFSFNRGTQCVETKVVGSSFYLDNFLIICGPKAEEGHCKYIEAF